ncbi:hypothetical protein Q3G72_022364 [Acer saccharum]|nr:hypothetical protein Q3G72_012844 [Acer saccharum]KAK1563102.1 hypothetical protein Q3G72_022364 [Acer saccharum]
MSSTTQHPGMLLPSQTKRKNVWFGQVCRSSENEKQARMTLHDEEFQTIQVGVPGTRVRFPTLDYMGPVRIPRLWFRSERTTVSHHQQDQNQVSVSGFFCEPLESGDFVEIVFHVGF